MCIKFSQFTFFKIWFQIAREMVISPQNRKLGLIALTKRVGLVNRPDTSDGDLIRYRVNPPLKQKFCLCTPLFVLLTENNIWYFFYIPD